MALAPLQNLCGFVARTEPADIPSPVLDRAKTVLVDTAGVIVAGSRTPHAAALASRIDLPAAAAGGATCFGRPELYAPLQAALLNGVAGSSLEFEEGNSRAKGHPAIQVLPAAAAVCEAQGVSGAEFLAALVLGYEVAARVSRAVALRRGLHPTGTWGVVASALAVGRALRRPAVDLFELANLAASYCLSPFVRNSFAGYSAASTFAGVVNQLGVLSNLFFDSGLRADPGSFEVSFSRFVSEGLDPAELEAGLGEEYAIAGGYLKPYPTCRFTHPAVDALKAALQGSSATAGEVESVEVETYDAAVHGSDRPPANAEAMRFSVPYLLAAHLRFLRLDRDVLTEETLRNPDVAALARRITVRGCPDLEALRPSRSPARVEVRLSGGRILRGEVLDALGDPQVPLSVGAVREKFLSLAEPVVGRGRALAFLEGAETAERLPDLRLLFAHLRTGA